MMLTSECVCLFCVGFAYFVTTNSDFDLLIDNFLTSKSRFDYVAFCKELTRCGVTQTPATLDQSQRRSPRKHTAASNSSSQRRRKQNNSHRGEEDFVAAKPRIRVDRRLEVQRLLTQSIRKKLMRGVFGAKSDGFLGVQDTLFNLDQDGEGFLDERVFTEQFLPRLKSPLSQSETEFLLMNIRMRGGQGDDKYGGKQQQHHGDVTSHEKKHKRHYWIDYEQMGVICNLDSDVSLSSGSNSEGEDDDAFFTGIPASRQQRSPAKHSKTSSSNINNLGADFLAAEKRLQIFLCQQEPPSDNSNGELTKDTPRSALTGAERFLEHAETIDSTKSGFLREQGPFYEASLMISKHSV